MKRVVLPGSSRPAEPHVLTSDTVAGDEIMQISVIIRHAPSAPKLEPLDKLGATLPQQRSYLTREAFARDYGADAKDMDLVKSFAAKHQLKVVSESAARRTLVLEGATSQMNEAFAVELARYMHDSGEFRSHKGEASLPEEVAGVIDAVLGLDNVPVAMPRYRQQTGGDAGTDDRAGHAVSYTPLDMADIYAFPDHLDGSGQCIGIIALQGSIDESALHTYFTKSLKLKAPEIVVIPINGAVVEKGSNPIADVEVMLDVQMAAALAPGARIVVYIGPDSSSRSFYDAASTAIYDLENRPSVLSTSWGGMEIKDWPHPPFLVTWTPQEIAAFHGLLEEAAYLGITFCAASGDAGSSIPMAAGPFCSVPMVDFPASSPYALGCGGTRLFDQADGNQRMELVWNDQASIRPMGDRVVNGGGTGGGVSRFFDMPSYQNRAGIKRAAYGQEMRGVPDVAGHAANNPGYKVMINGKFGAIGGTSAVAPLWAALVARINQGIGVSAGFINPLLYRFQLEDNAGICNPITEGCNGAYYASEALPWNACTGLGSPNGKCLLSALQIE